MKFLFWIKENFTKSLPLTFAVFLLLTCFRGIENWLLSQNQYLENISGLFISGLFNDLLFCLFLLFLLSFVPWYKNKLVKNLVLYILGLLLTISLISTFFFIISLQLLDRTIYQFSFDQILTIIQTFGAFKWYYLFIVFPIPLLFLLNNFLQKKSIEYGFLITGSIITVLYFSTAPKIEWDFEKLAIKNKVEYFVVDSYNYFNGENENTKPSQFTDLSKEYPLLKSHPERNPLSGLFKLRETPPNLVFLIVESLSSAYSGPLAEEISFTPFLDSLAQHSIYLNNFIATSQRTFGVLPSTFASLPHGKRGFSYMRSNMPNHHSILSILTENGYNASFFYGGDSNFDFMNTFMEVNGVSTIIDHSKKYDISKKTKEDEGKAFGVNDSIFFQEVANSWQNKLSTPFIHTYLSLSMHYPFELENQAHYINLAKNIIDQKAAEKAINKEKYSKQLKLFSTAVYTDRAIRNLFKRYQKENAYQNTIFIIYGDHSFGPTPKRNALEKYRTPLYIYSPLLKNIKHSSNVNSHLDLPPTVINLLKDTFNFDYPKKTHWLGKPFVFSKNNKREIEQVLMMNNREVEDFLSNNYLLSKNKLFSIDEAMNTQLLDNKKIYDSLSKRRDSLVFYQGKALDNNSLIADNGPEDVLESKLLNGRKFSQNNEYVMLLEHKLEKSEKAIQIDLDLNLNQYLQNELKEAPLLIMVFKDENNQVVYFEEIDYLFQKNADSITINKKMYFKNNSNLPLNEGLTLKTYFWNKKKSDASFEFINSTIKLKAKR